MFDKEEGGQILLLDGDEVTLHIIGYSRTRFQRAFLYFLYFISGGLVYLACRWFPRFELFLSARRDSLTSANLILVGNNWGQISILPVCIDRSYRGEMKDVFPNYIAHLAQSELGTPLPSEFWKLVHEADLPIGELRYFEYRYHSLVFNPITRNFQGLSEWRDLKWDRVEKLLEGVESHQVVAQRQLLFGKNELNIREKPTLELLFDEILHPFYVFQIASIILWSLDDYYYYAACIFGISAASAILTLFETKKTLKKINDMAKFDYQVKVWRGSTWWPLASSELVAGDIFEITPGVLPILPCDALLLDGDCIMNESMLTGESLPVAKGGISNEELNALDFQKSDPIKSPEMTRFFLFSGTKVIRSRCGKHGARTIPCSGDVEAGPGALAMCVRVGFNTTKGSLVRSIMFPRPNKFQFYRDSWRFIGVLAIIACLGFAGISARSCLVVSFYNFVLLATSWQTIVVRALDLITIIIPPALPAAMAIGTSFAINRLRKSMIHCTSPPRVNICGKLDLICFDKTGTLTEEGLDILGFRFTTPQEKGSENVIFSRLYRSLRSRRHLDAGQNMEPTKSLACSMSTTSGFSPTTIDANTPPAEEEFPYPLIICGMATCHSLKIVNGELIGDPLDLQMFQFTGWEMEDKGVSSSSITQKASVSSVVGTVVRPPGSQEMEALWRDSLGFVVTPTATPSISSKHEQPDRINSGNQVINNDVNTELGVVRLFDFVSGLRRMSVIVSRVRTNLDDSIERPSSPKDFEVGAPEALKEICRPCTLPDDYEKILKRYTHQGYRVIAVAYKLLENFGFLKLTKLRRTDVECNLNFLGFIIFENKMKDGTCEVIKRLHRACIRQVMVTGDNSHTSISVSRECGLIHSESRIFVPHFQANDVLLGHPSDQIRWEDCEDEDLILDPVTLIPRRESGDFAAIPSFDSYNIVVTGSVFQWMLDFGSEELMQRLLVKAHIFARMSPDQKHILVEHLQQLGYCVGFCGDGANDCGALKAADVGLSLSEAEASVAAPFTSQTTNLSCILKLIREGRAALVTSFSCFKYMATYSLVQFTSVSLLYSLKGNVGDFQFLFIDIGLILPLAATMARSEAHHSLDPKAPTSRLVSKRVLISLIGQVFIQVFFQFWIFFWVRRQDWYVKSPSNVEEKMFASQENTVVFLTSCFQYVIVAAEYSVGKPYRREVWRNVSFMCTTAVIITALVYITLFPHHWIKDKLDLVDIPESGTYYILSLAFINLCCSWVCESYVFAIVSEALGNMNLGGSILKIKVDRMRYTDIDRLSDVEQRAVLTDAEEARRKNWKSRGKIYRCVEADLQAGCSRSW